MNIILIGPAYPYRGGLATYDERLVQEFQKEEHNVQIYTFTLQYPSFLFPGKTQYSDRKYPENITIKRKINSCNPFNWIKIGKEIKKIKPDIILFRYWMSFMAPCFGTIARIARKNKHTKIISIVDNMIPHEKRFFDNVFSKYFVKPVDGFIAMSESVLKDIEQFKNTDNKKFAPHPLYDNFGEKIEKQEALQCLSLESKYNYLLFFGLIRDYKGLDILIEAFADKRLREFPVKLVIAGEFYSNPEPYYELIEKYNLSENIILKAEFVADDDVKYYFSAADLIVQPYKSATQSGVTQIAYHFEKPMLVTNVGGLSEMVPHMKVGYVTEPTAKSIADALVDFYENTPDFSREITIEKQKYFWSNITDAVIQLAEKNESTK